MNKSDDIIDLLDDISEEENLINQSYKQEINKKSTNEIIFLKKKQKRCTNEIVNLLTECNSYNSSSVKEMKENCYLKFMMKHFSFENGKFLYYCEEDFIRDHKRKNMIKKNELKKHTKNKISRKVIDLDNEKNENSQEDFTLEIHIEEDLSNDLSNDLTQFNYSLDDLVNLTLKKQSEKFKLPKLKWKVSDKEKSKVDDLLDKVFKIWTGVIPFEEDAILAYFLEMGLNENKILLEIKKNSESFLNFIRNFRMEIDT